MKKGTDPIFVKHITKALEILNRIDEALDYAVKHHVTIDEAFDHILQQTPATPKQVTI